MLSAQAPGRGSDQDVLAAMTYKPADIIHVNAGRLQKGKPADLALIDLNHEWEINPRAFQSRSKNSPYVGTKAKGRTIRTVVGGEVVFVL